MHWNKPPLKLRNILRQGLWITGILVLVYVGVSGFIESYLTPENASEAEWIDTNIQAVQRLKGSVCFAVIGGHPMDRAPFQAILTAINRDADIRFTINLADMMKRGQEREYIDLLNLYRNKCRKPLLPAFGTHDSRAFGGGSYTLFFGPHYYSFQVGNICFVMLDTSLSANITDRQIRWLKATLVKAREHRCRTLVFMSVPLSAPGNRRERSAIPPEKASRILELFGQFPPAHVFTSHSSGDSSPTLGNGIPHTSIGFSSHSGGGDPHFLKVTITAGRIRTEIRGLKQIRDKFEFKCK